jgi:hypothetical protein
MTPKYSEDASKKLISFQKTALLVVTPLAVEMSPDMGTLRMRYLFFSKIVLVILGFKER